MVMDDGEKYIFRTLDGEIDQKESNNPESG